MKAKTAVNTAVIAGHTTWRIEIICACSHIQEKVIQPNANTTVGLKELIEDMIIAIAT